MRHTQDKHAIDVYSENSQNIYQFVCSKIVLYTSVGTKVMFHKPNENTTPEQDGQLTLSCLENMTAGNDDIYNRPANQEPCSIAHAHPLPTLRAELLAERPQRFQGRRMSGGFPAAATVRLQLIAQIWSLGRGSTQHTDSRVVVSLLNM
ncbi:hypothetical protein J6590_015153 [Homalodisca vitripennis]|nr:hypothetical protein J6590_015153 [Homalodisca vitripennis]